MTNVTRLPGPVSEVWDWQIKGLCRGRDSAQFFHPDGERGSSRGRREAAAKNVCRACPVRAECAAHALAVREPYGVWGGLTEAERLRLLAAGWEDLYDRRTGRVDIARLEHRLGLRPAPGTGTPGQQHVPAVARKTVPPIAASRRTTAATTPRGPSAPARGLTSTPQAGTAMPAQRKAS